MNSNEHKEAQKSHTEKEGWRTENIPYPFTCHECKRTNTACWHKDDDGNKLLVCKCGETLIYETIPEDNMNTITFGRKASIGIDHKLNQNDLYLFLEFTEERFPDAIETYITEWAERFAIGREHAIQCMDPHSKRIFERIENKARGLQ